MKRLLVPVGIFLVLCLAACSGPEEKKARFFEKGQELYEQGDYVKAALEYKNALQIDPKWAEAYYMLGKSEGALGKLRASMGRFAKVIELEPEHWGAHLEQGRFFLAAKEFDLAQQKAELVLATEPENVNAVLLKAAVLLARGDDAAAGLLLSTLRKDVKDLPLDGYLLLTAVYRKQDRIDLAKAELLAAAEAHPDKIAPLVSLAEIQAEAKELEQAIQTMEKVAQKDPENKKVPFVLARLHAQNNTTEKAEQVLRAYRDADPEDTARVIDVANFKVSLKDLEGAIAVLREGLAKEQDSLDLRLALARIHGDLVPGGQPRAIALLKECIEIEKIPDEPNLLLARNALARLYFNRQQIAEAEEQINKIVEASPRNVDGQFTKGKIHLLKKEGPEAVASFRIVVEEKPDVTEAHLRLAEAHVLSREMGLARDVLQNRLKVETGSPELLRALSRLALVQKDWAGAESSLNALLQAHPQAQDVRAELADLLLATGQKDKAKLLYQEIVNQAPNIPLGYVKLANLSRKDGDMKGAIRQLELGTQKVPNSNALAKLLVQHYLQNKQLKKAESFTRKRSLDQKDNPLAMNLFGDTLAAVKKFDAAEKAYKKAIELHPEWGVPRNGLAGLRLHRGDKAGAIQGFESAIATDPSNLDAYFLLGQIHLKEGDRGQAIRWYERALEQNPRSWQAANDLANLLADNTNDNRQMGQALRYAQWAQRLNPMNPVVLDTLGWVHFQKGNMDTAVEWFRRAHALAPEHPVINYHLGAGLFATGDTLAAQPLLKKSVESGRDFDGRKDAEALLERM